MNQLLVVLHPDDDESSQINDYVNIHGSVFYSWFLLVQHDTKTFKEKLFKEVDDIMDPISPHDFIRKAEKLGYSVTRLKSVKFPTPYQDLDFGD